MSTPMRPSTQDIHALRPVADAPSRWKVLGRTAGTIWSNRKARAGVIMLGLFILVAIFAPLIAPYGATENGFDRSADPSVLSALFLVGRIRRILSTPLLLYAPAWRCPHR